MSSFTRFDTTLKIEYLLEHNNKNNVECWLLLDGFRFYSDRVITNKRIWVEVPRGFISDGASVPRLLWSWIPPLGRYGQAAVLHDYLRVVKEFRVEGTDNIHYVTTKESDDLFLEAMEVLKVGWFKRNIMYLAVRAMAIIKGT